MKVNGLPSWESTVPIAALDVSVVKLILLNNLIGLIPFLTSYAFFNLMEAEVKSSFIFILHF